MFETAQRPYAITLRTHQTNHRSLQNLHIHRDLWMGTPCVFFVSHLGFRLVVNCLEIMREPLQIEEDRNGPATSTLVLETMEVLTTLMMQGRPIGLYESQDSILCCKVCSYRYP